MQTKGRIMGELCSGIKYQYKNKIYCYCGTIMVKMKDGSWKGHILYQSEHDKAIYARDVDDFFSKFTTVV